eukprot:1001599-Rhodomonas_salina.6
MLDPASLTSRILLDPHRVSYVGGRYSPYAARAGGKPCCRQARYLPTRPLCDVRTDLAYGTVLCPDARMR